MKLRSEYFVDKKVIVMLGRFAEIYSYRTMIWSLVKRDLKGRYTDSFLGVLWNFLNPLLQLLVYTFVFSKVMRAGVEDYYMFLFVALIPWIFFSTSITGGASCIVNQKDMVKKIYFPREVLPISFVTAQFVNMLLCFIVIFIVMLIGGYKLNIKALVTLPMVMIVEFIVALGCAMVVSACSVYFRDLQHIMGIVAMALQFLTPVMYSSSDVPESMWGLFYLNPMTYVIESYRAILYYGMVPDMWNLFKVIVMGIVVLIMGWFIFDRIQKHFIEVL